MLSMIKKSKWSNKLEPGWLVVRPNVDNVAIGTSDLLAGTIVRLRQGALKLKHHIKQGQRFAVCDIPAGRAVVQYGCEFGLSTGIPKGGLIHAGNVRELGGDPFQIPWRIPPPTVYRKKLLALTFDGYLRRDGRAGTRNYYLIVPTSMCASETAAQIAAQASSRWPADSSFDGIVAIPHTEGCGCAANVQIDRLLMVLGNYITHPNVGAVLIVDLGCEQTNYKRLRQHLLNRHAMPVPPADWLTIQKEGGVAKTISKALSLIERRLPTMRRVKRQPCPLGKIVLGTECGASDVFSGITANPVIGYVADQVVWGRGFVILSEIPEMIGAEHVLISRMRSRKVVNKFLSLLKWYKECAEKLGVAMSDNLVPENKAGGLINPCIKSLGAIVKGGSTVIEDAVDYGVRITRRGLNLMQGPGNDIESVTGLVAGGANVICFSTGKGAITGSAIVPAIKVASTTALYQRMQEDIDFDAGRYLEATCGTSIPSMGRELFKIVLATASGRKTKTEQHCPGGFQVWTAGKLSL